MEVLESVITSQHKTERIKIFEELYELAFPHAARFTSKMGGTLEDARDIFQDALVIFYEKNRLEDFSIHTSTEAYIIGIVKHLWIRKYKNERHHVRLSEWELKLSIPPDYFPDYNSIGLLKFLERAGEKCLDLLRAFYYKNLSMIEIAESLGYKNERSATVQKYKCLEKVRDTIKEKSLHYEDFTE